MRKQKNGGPLYAALGFDPLPAKLEIENQIKVIHEGKVVALVVAKEDFLKEIPNVWQSIK